MEKTAFAPIATLRERLMLIVKALMPLAPMALAVLWLNAWQKIPNLCFATLMALKSFCMVFWR